MSKGLPIMELGKLPPQVTDIEEAVLGGLMLEPNNTIHQASEKLKPDDFYKDAHQRIYRAILEMYVEGVQIDLMTVTARLKKQGDLEMVGGPYEITMLTSRVSSTTHIATWVNEIKKASLRRTLIAVSHESSKAAYDDTTDIEDHLQSTIAQLIQIGDLGRGNKYESFKELAKARFEEIKNIRSGKIKETKLQTHINQYNDIIVGFTAPDLIILAARPSMGKTALMLSLALYVSKSAPVAIFSLEMSKKQLTDRALSIMSGINHYAIQNPKYLSENQIQILEDTIKQFEQLPLYIDDTSALTILELRAKATRLKAEKNIGMIFMDYLQLMKGGSDNKNRNRENEISEISGGLKRTAKDLDVPVMALSQLNREVEKRPTKKPQLSDLRESGTIEQDADQVVFLFRPDYYGFQEYEDYNAEEIELLGVMDIAKHRNGPTGECHLGFDKNIMYYTDLDEITGNKENKISAEFDFEEYE